MEMVKVEGGVAVLLSEHFGDWSILELVVKEGPLVAKSGHVFDIFFMFLLERYGGGDLVQGIRHQCIAQTGCCLLFLRWE